MITECNIQNLMRLVRNNEEATGFDLRAWFHPCGTFGCLVGNDCIAIGAVDGAKDFGLWAMREYGLPAVVIPFLFSSYELARGSFGIECEAGDFGVMPYLNAIHRRDFADREAALNRVRKFIAYVERKRAIMYTADWRVAEIARRTEGNWNVCAQVMQTLALAP
jgi:hypothetical protein